MTSNPIRILIGYDPREAVAYHTCCQSIIENCSRPQDLSFTPVTGPQHDGSNRFIYARFEPFVRVPAAKVIFIDGDMTCLGDIAELWDLFDPRYAVQVVKHHYETKFPRKYWGLPNADYPRKNWSSVMLMNPMHRAHIQRWPEIRSAIDGGHGAFLHRFAWLADELIGELPPVWNWLAKEYPYRPDVKLVHHTIGLPLDPAGEGDPWASNWTENYLAAMRYRP